MRMRDRRLLATSLALVLMALPAAARDDLPSTAQRPDHQQSAREHEGDPEPPPPPPLPPDMTLDQVLDRAASSPPPSFPDPVMDDALRASLLVDQLEYRLGERGVNALGWETQAWLGYDFDKLWWKSEGENAFTGPDEGEAENDLLYSRLITPFWNAQLGAQYASEWEGTHYSDRWSGVVALQGLAPGMFELDTSLYLSENADLTADIEAEYDVRVTQRLVLQPRVEMGFAAQDVDERDLGAGLTDVDLDVRLRYELLRELAPYVGFRYRLLVGETGNIAERAGRDDATAHFLAGLRLAF